MPTNGLYLLYIVVLVVVVVIIITVARSDHTIVVRVERLHPSIDHLLVVFT